MSSIPLEGPSKRAREMPLGGGAGSGDEESSNVSAVENEGRPSFVFADCLEVSGEWVVFFLSSMSQLLVAFQGVELDMLTMFRVMPSLKFLASPRVMMG